MPQYIENTPEAGRLMGSMRSMGYTFESAMADIIDNSISACCHEIHLFFPTEASTCYVAVLDDGVGMNKKELFKAMRYGSSAYEDTRSETDLGRFGLGMKSASLSQCQVLTVASKNNGVISAYRWDYNQIKGQKSWLMGELYEDEIQDLPHIDDLKSQNQGTLVVWQDFDIISKSSSGLVFETLMKYKANMINYTGLIFHRFINSSVKKDRVSIFINKHKVEALDPFLEKHEKTTERKEIDLVVNDKDGNPRHISVTPFILPFIKDLSEKDIEKLGGTENMRVKQGFYIYRNKRLIIWGTWFGMQRTELTKNARIRVDIPNCLDDIWSIDIKKQNATIPVMIQKQLKRAVEDAMNFSVRQQTHRGRRNNLDSKINYVWNRMEGRDENHYYYEINRQTELFKFVRSKISDEAYNYVEMLIDEIEKGIPFQQMYLDTANNNLQPEENPEHDAELLQRAILLVNNYISMGLNPKKIIDDIVMHEESFTKVLTLKEELYKKYAVK